MAEGWIKLYRKLRENKYWLEPRRFSKAEAWIDILLMASHKDVEFILGNITIYLKKGQLLRSQVKLAEKWGWNRETVNNYLKMLKRDGQIDYKTSNKYTIITVLNWSNYQGLSSDNPATNPVANSTSKQHQNNTKSGTINNVKNEKNNIDTLIKEAEKELTKMAKKEIVLKHLEIIPKKYHYKIRYFLIGRYKDGDKVYQEAKDEYENKRRS